MKITNIAILTLINLLFTIGTFAAAPTNDNIAAAKQLIGIVQIHTSGTNVDATKEANEPNHAGNAGGRSVWFKWTAPMSRCMQISTNRTTANLDTLLAVYTGTPGSLHSLAASNNIDPDSNLRSRLTFNAIAGTIYYIAIDGYSDSDTSAATGSFRLDVHPYFMFQGADFDRDGMTDLSLFRPSTSEWWVKGTTRSSYTKWGTNGDIPMIGSLIGTPGQTVFRPSTGRWYFQNAPYSHQFALGQSGDIPVTERFDGSGTGPAIFRPSTGVWYLYSINETTVDHYQFGLQGDIPVAGQYSPDAFADVAVFRPSDGNWHFLIRRSENREEDSYRSVHFGQAGDEPVPADYDGDGILDIAVYRPSTGVWYVLKSDLEIAISTQWGIAEDVPTVGDFDGDGRADYAVFRPSTGTWYILRTSGGMQTEQFGQAGDIPMTSNRTF